MKLYLTLFFLFSFAGISAQNRKLADPQTSRFDFLSVINDPTSQIITPDLRKIKPHIISNTKNKESIVKNFTVVQESAKFLITKPTVFGVKICTAWFVPGILNPDRLPKK